MCSAGWRRSWHTELMLRTPLLAVLALALIFPRLLGAAPKAEAWERWSAHDAASERVVNHTMWERLLARYVVPGDDGIHRVRYGAFSAEDRGYLSLYLSDMQRVPVSSLRRAEQRAYWINLYNALTVKLVVDRYPISSILDIEISPGWFSKGPWGAKLLSIEGHPISLDDIEHRILRPLWQDPRIHYAVNCASIGCPNLSTDIYTASNTEAQLETAARAFINHPRGAVIRDGKLFVSSIYEWFKADFGGDDAGVIAHLRQYADPALLGSLANVRKLAGDEYDWALNDQR